MLRSAVWTLRQRRYLGLALLMLVVAAICVLAGTWQISRYKQSVRDNRALRHNAHAPVTALTTALVPLVGAGPAPGRDAIRYRTVSVTGTYLGGREQYVSGASVDGADGFLVLDPLRTAAGVLPVVRGFVAATSAGDVPTVAAPPTGTVTVRGRLQTASTSNDHAGDGGAGVVSSVNPVQQAARLGTPTYDAYLSLLSGQPGTAGVTVLPKPDLSNPAGGAYEAQHLAYIVQWYLFALLALAAPFAMSRYETRDAQRRFLGIDPDVTDLDRALAGLPDRPNALLSGVEAGVERGVVGPAGVPAVGSAVAIVDAGRDIDRAADRAAGLAVRARGVMARPGDTAADRTRRGVRMAARYGRSFGHRPPADVDAVAEESAPVAVPHRPGGIELLEPNQIQMYDPVANSAEAPHRSPDDYHGAYNDHLWQLAMADAQAAEPQPAADEPGAGPRPAADAAAPRPFTGTVILPDGEVVTPDE